MHATTAPVGTGGIVATPRRLRSAAIAVAGVLVVSWTIVLAITGTDIAHPGLHAALATWVSVPYIGAGLVAWHRRPESRFGPLMVTAGLLTCIGFLVQAEHDLLFTVGLVADALPPILFLHVFLAFPTGRLPSRVDRVVVGAGYAIVGLNVVRLLLGAEAPRNMLAVTDVPVADDPLLMVRLVGVSVVSLAGIAVLVARRRRAGRPPRAAAGRLVDSFVVGLVMLALLAPAALFEWPVVEQIRLTTFFVTGLAPFVFLFGLLHAQLARGSVATLMVELGSAPGPAPLRAAIARALRDPSVIVAYWLPEFSSYADLEGHPLDVDELTANDPPCAATPVLRDGRPVAMLLHDPALDDEPDLVRSVAAAAGMAIENAQLQVELRARVEELRGSRARILAAGEEERRRLERDLHDGAQQRLVALSLELARLEVDVGGNPALQQVVRTAREEVAESLEELRGLAHGLHPSVVTDHGLAVALEALATRSPVPCLIGATIEERLPAPVEVTAYFVVSEALANATKHAAASAVVVTARHDDGHVVVDVTDDGRGGATTEGGTGLRGLADRVEALGGRLRVWSPAGVGTRVSAEIPCAR